MKTIVKRSEIIELLLNINDENKDQIVIKLKDLYDEEGKNPLIISLEEKLYRSFYSLINPVQYNGEYCICFDPFNISVTTGKKHINWDIDDSKYDNTETFEGFFDTRDNYCSMYSAYTYILHIEDDIIRNTLINMCFNIDYDIVKKMKLGSYPSKDRITNYNSIYKEEDIIKYIEYPLQESILSLHRKNIPVSRVITNRFSSSISFNMNNLSKENQAVLKELINIGLAKYDSDLITIEMIHNNPNYTIESINMSYKAIINLFKEQEITIGIINIEDYYKNICYLLKHYGIELPTNPTITDIIDICKRYNTKLTHKTGKLYYIHPSLKERDNTYTLKKNNMV